MTWRRRVGIAALILLVLWGAVALVPPPVAPSYPFFSGLGSADGGAGDVLVIAHRGGRHLGPENTLFQFRRAVELGVDVLEMDVHRTADSVLVVVHDDTVGRTTDGSGAVNALTLTQVRRLDAGYDWSPPGDEGGHPFRGRGIRIPTFEEVLLAFPGHPLLVELKTPDAASAESLCGALRAHGHTDRAVVASFHTEALTHFRRTCPGVATSASSSEVRSYLIWHLLRLDVLSQPAFQAFQVPETIGPLTLVDRRFVETARARNLAVEVWTVNREQDMERMIDRGVHGIITDRPDLLLQILRRRGAR